MNEVLASHGFLRRGCNSCPSTSNSNARALNAGQHQEFVQSGRACSVYRRIGGKWNSQRIGHSRSFWHVNYNSGQIWGIRKLGRGLFEQRLSRSSLSKHRALDKLKGSTERYHTEKEEQNVGTWKTHRLRCEKSHTDAQMEGSNSGARKTFTVEDAIREVGFGQYQLWLLAYAGMSWTAEAMEMMLLSFVGPAVQSEWGLSGRQESLIASVVFGGMMIGAYSWGVLSDWKGRRFGFFATAVLTFGAGILSAASTNYLTLMVLRGLVGVGLGGGPVISAWFMEFVPSANRGRWMVIINLFWTLGSIAEASLAWVVMPTLGWRWLLALSSIPLAILLLFYNLTPESPRYLAVTGETEQAFKILQQMANTNGRPLPYGTLVTSQQKLGHPVVERSLLEASLEMGEGAQPTERNDGLLLPNNANNERSLPLERKPNPSGVNQIFSNFASLLSLPLLKSTLLLWSVFFANAFTYYGLVLLTSQLSSGACEANVAATLPSAADSTEMYRNVFVSSIGELPGLLMAATAVDWIGRKHSMAGLFAFCAAFLFPLVHVQPGELTTFLLFGARACIMGAFTILTIYAPEVYPTSSRSTGLGIANAIARVGGLLCPLVAVDLVRSCQQGLAVSLFVAVPLFAGIAVLFFPVETKGKPLSDRVECNAQVRK